MKLTPYYSDSARKSLYWNECIETMPREELEAIHLKRLRGVIQYAFDNVPMYTKLYRHAGVKPEDIRSIKDYIDMIPVIDKKNIVQFQQSSPPFGKTIIPGAEEYLTYRYQTSGSTGTPMQEAGFFTDPMDLWNYGWWAHGIRPNDIFYIAFGFGTFMGFWTAYPNGGASNSWRRS